MISLRCARVGDFVRFDGEHVWRRIESFGGRGWAGTLDVHFDDGTHRVLHGSKPCDIGRCETVA